MCKISRQFIVYRRFYDYRCFWSYLIVVSTHSSLGREMIEGFDKRIIEFIKSQPAAIVGNALL